VKQQLVDWRSRQGHRDQPEPNTIRKTGPENYGGLMERMKVRVAPNADFRMIVHEASKLGAIALENEKRRFLVVECDKPEQLEGLRHLGCDIVVERRYDIDISDT
jgi:hypothetical protein